LRTPEPQTGNVILFSSWQSIRFCIFPYLQSGVAGPLRVFFSLPHPSFIRLLFPKEVFPTPCSHPRFAPHAVLLLPPPCFLATFAAPAHRPPLVPLLVSSLHSSAAGSLFFSFLRYSWGYAIFTVRLMVEPTVFPLTVFPLFADFPFASLFLSCPPFPLFLILCSDGKHNMPPLMPRNLLLNLVPR